MLKGTRICFTGGATNKYGKPILRHRLIELAQKEGAKVHSHASPNTDLLVCKAKHVKNPSIKLQKAISYGTKLMSYSEFFDKLRWFGYDLDRVYPVWDKPSPEIEATGEEVIS